MSGQHLINLPSVWYKHLIEAHIDAQRQTWDTSSPPSAPNNAATLRVYVRVRPLLPRDLEQGAFALAAVQAPCTIHFTHPTLTWSGGRFATKTYEADGVLDTDAHNDEVWASVGMERVIKEAMECEKEVCLVAYGQTGTGKTYTTTYLECAFFVLFITLA